MSEDWLRRATRSLRDESGEITPDETARTRARVMASLTLVERRRNRVVLLLIPIAAVLAASLALAHEGITVRRTWGWIATRVSGAPEPARVEARRGPVAEPALPAPSEIPAAPADMPSPPSPSIPTAAAPATASPASSRPARTPAIASPAPDAPSPRPVSIDAPAASDENYAAGLALYRKAHRLHFVDHDYAGSLAAWDDYLRAVPGGPLAVEARYNRAIALVRLGRDAEARAALEPFARGRVEGGYRQAEANALLDALESRDR